MPKFTRSILTLVATTSFAVAGFGSTALAKHGADDPASHEAGEHQVHKASHKHHRHHHHQVRHHGRDDGPNHR